MISLSDFPLFFPFRPYPLTVTVKTNKESGRSEARDCDKSWMNELGLLNQEEAGGCVGRAQRLPRKNKRTRWNATRHDSRRSKESGRGDATESDKSPSPACLWCLNE